jgi:L-lactate dehydrogenase complex protein LldF
MKNYRPFLNNAEKKVFDQGHRKRINYNISKYNLAVPQGKKQFSDFELACEKASYIKRKVLNNLEKYLLDFDNNFTRNGGKLFWAESTQEAQDILISICRENNIRSVIKSKSMVSEEIHMNKILEYNQIEALESDLGEFIVQLENEAPYHIVTPAMHKSKEDIADLFHRKFATPLDFTPEKLTLEARKILRNKFLSADAGITGANFLIADSGAISVTENEGNARMSTAFPRIHIAVTGIEKIIPSIEDLPLFLPLLASMGTGQIMTTYNNLFFGPKKADDMDGPEKMYLILIDNGRTELLKTAPQNEALTCIRCGACLNACPVYKNIGGHTYNSIYNGPIGSVITPFLQNFHDYIHLSHASSLCHNCTEVCPVKINIAELLLQNRKYYNESFNTNKKEKRIWQFFTRTMMKRSRMNFGNYKIKNRFLRIVLKNNWSKHRTPLELKKKSFNRLWKEMHKDGHGI